MRMLKEVNMTENTVANRDNSSEKTKLRYSSYSRGCWRSQESTHQRRNSMAEKRRNLALAGYDEIFGGNDSQGNDGTEKVQMISVKELFPFKDHPFRVVDDEAMLRTVESVSQFGVIVPAIVRPREEGGYEIVSGHRRKHAAELAGLTEIPVIVRDLDDDAATILMVDSNLQRETLLPSERAWAYRMKAEAMERTLGRPKKEGQIVPNFQGIKTLTLLVKHQEKAVVQFQDIFVSPTSSPPSLTWSMPENSAIMPP